MVMRDLIRNKKVNQNKLTNDQIIQEKTKSTNCLFIQHIGKKSVLKPAYSCNQHQIHDQSSMT